MGTYYITPFSNGIELNHTEEYDGRLIDAKLRSRQICYTLQAVLKNSMIVVEIQDEDGRVRHTEMVYISIDQCIEGHAYRIRARNGRIGIFKKEMSHGKNVFALSRHKGNNYVDFEYHWDNGPPNGTVMPFNDLGEAPQFKDDQEKLDYLNKLDKEIGGVEYPEFVDIKQKYSFKNPDAVEDPLTKQMVEVLEFYANPETYFAMGFLPDPPCGEFVDDFSAVDELGMKPGKKARAILDKYKAQLG